MPETAAVYQTAYQAMDLGLYQEAVVPENTDTELPTVEEANNGYTISEIAALLGEEWFHGFISSGECTAKVSRLLALIPLPLVLVLSSSSHFSLILTHTLTLL
jgi:hypothetical protein